MARRISKKPTDLHSMLSVAVTGITAEGAAWPAAAPAAAFVTTVRDDLFTLLQDLLNAEAAADTARSALHAQTDLAYQTMQRIDETTDLLYGPKALEKSNFGLTPKGATPLPPIIRLEQVTCLDGTGFGSIKVDWKGIEGASYELKWYSDAALTTEAGAGTTAEASNFTATGLTPGAQYWFVVRPIRGGEIGPWSEPATRVCPVL